MDSLENWIIEMAQDYMVEFCNEYDADVLLELCRFAEELSVRRREGRMNACEK